MSPHDPDSNVAKVYRARTQDEQQAAYDGWSASYEQELCALGYRLPAYMAACFTRFVPEGTGPILDAGCGGGLQTEALAAIGYGPFTGIDLSEGMLAVARTKGIYADLRCMALGGRLDFASDSFGAILSSGTITPGHAPPESFDDLIRIARPGAPILFSLRCDSGQDPAYDAALDRLEAADLWRKVFVTDPFQTMPYGEPEIFNRVHVYTKT